MEKLQIKNFSELSNVDFKNLYKLHMLLPKNDQMSYESFLEEFSYQNRKYLFAILGSKIVGYIGVIDVIDAYEIMGIAVDKKFQKMGIGKKLLDSMITLAKTNNINLIALEVDVSNKNAIEFYKKNGFRVTNIRKKYYRDNDAYVMHYSL